MAVHYYNFRYDIYFRNNNIQPLNNLNFMDFKGALWRNLIHLNTIPSSSIQGFFPFLMNQKYRLHLFLFLLRFLVSFHE